MPSVQSPRPSFSRRARPPGCKSSPTRRSGSAKDRSRRHILKGFARFVEARAWAKEQPTTPAPTMMMSYEVDHIVDMVSVLEGSSWDISSGAMIFLAFEWVWTLF